MAQPYGGYGHEPTGWPRGILIAVAVIAAVVIALVAFGLLSGSDGANDGGSEYFILALPAALAARSRKR